jgi:hypothetical protein
VPAPPSAASRPSPALPRGPLRHQCADQGEGAHQDEHVALDHAQRAGLHFFDDLQVHGNAQQGSADQRHQQENRFG